MEGTGSAGGVGARERRAFALAGRKTRERGEREKGGVWSRGFGRVWVAFEAVFYSGVRFLGSLFCFLPPASLSPPALTPFERGERETTVLVASATLTLNSLLVRGTGCHSEGPFYWGRTLTERGRRRGRRRAGPAGKLEARCQRRLRVGPACLRRTGRRRKISEV
jgi:hypothetical protein